MTVAADTAALNIVLKGFCYGLIDNDGKAVASSEQHTQLKTRVQKPYPI